MRRASDLVEVVEEDDPIVRKVPEPIAVENDACDDRGTFVT